MESMVLPFKAQIKALREGKFNLQTAKIIVDNLKTKVSEGNFGWEDIGTSSGELELILLKLAPKPLPKT